MKVIDARNNETGTPVGELQFGQLFGYDTTCGMNYYMRASNPIALNERAYAANLKTGDVVFFSSETLVTPLEGELTIR
jgi:hypothetical protein